MQSLTVQERIKQKIKRFDSCSLLKLLKEIGYEDEDIFYQSNSDLSSRSTLCEDIIFSESAPKVTIILNIGLLSSSSPLPSLFRKKMDSGSIDPVQFTRFISFFDHHIIKNLLAMSMPETDNNFFTSWKETQGYYLKMLDLNSTSTLWHAFQICFPELIVKVVKSPQFYKQNSSSIMLGSTKLGVDSFLGKKIDHSIPSFKFTLIGEETLTDFLIPWPLEVKRRLKNTIFGLLQRTSIHFHVTFIIKNNKDVAKLSPSLHLGYCRIGKNDRPLKLKIFSGYASDLNKLSCN